MYKAGPEGIKLDNYSRCPVIQGAPEFTPFFFSGVHVTQSFLLCVMFCRTLSFWPLCCLSFFDLRILITSLVSQIKTCQSLVSTQKKSIVYSQITTCQSLVSTQNLLYTVKLKPVRVW
jgi:hypothetical protein